MAHPVAAKLHIALRGHWEHQNKIREKAGLPPLPFPPDEKEPVKK